MVPAKSLMDWARVVVCAASGLQLKDITKHAPAQWEGGGPKSVFGSVWWWSPNGALTLRRETNWPDGGGGGYRRPPARRPSIEGVALLPGFFVVFFSTPPGRCLGQRSRDDSRKEAVCARLSSIDINIFLLSINMSIPSRHTPTHTHTHTHTCHTTWVVFVIYCSAIADVSPTCSDLAVC